MAFADPQPHLIDQVNCYIHQREIFNASSHAVVRENVDTLYSNLVYDLSQNDLSVTLPEIPNDRFHVIAIYDM